MIVQYYATLRHTLLLSSYFSMAQRHRLRNATPSVRPHLLLF